MAFKKILTHPDKNKIIKLLTEGVGVREVSKQLKEKYPRNTKLQVSANSLQEFRSQHLNLEKEALEEIKKANSEAKEAKAFVKDHGVVKSMPAYRERIKEIIDYKVDIHNELKELILLGKSRIEALFDKAASGEATINEEKNLQTYMSNLQSNLERYAKYVEGFADKTIETNVNITVIEDQMLAMREAVKETLEEMDGEMAVRFLEKLNQKITTLSFKSKNNVSFANVQENKALVANIEDVCEDDDD
jgi:hypothetical protein